MPEGKAFEFRLETLLSYRKRQLDLHAQALAEAQRVCNGAHARRGRLFGERAVCRRAISTPDDAGRLDVDASRSLNRYIQHLAEAITSQEVEIERLNEETETRRVEAVEASKRKKVVERLRQRDMEKFFDGLADDERKFLDEVGSVRAATRGRSARTGGQGDSPAPRGMIQ